MPAHRLRRPHLPLCAATARPESSCRSPRTTCGRSNWPRRRCVPGIDLLMGYAGVDALGDMRLAGAFGAHIDPLYALVLGPGARRTRRSSALGRQCRRRWSGARAAVDAGAHRARSGRHVPSSRSKRPPSHSSRSCSSQPWPFRTPLHHRRTSAPWSRCPNELHLSMPLGAVDAADRRTGHEFH